VAPVFRLYRFSDEDVVWWRLVSLNGRGIARVAAPLESPEAALVSIERARAAVATDDLQPLLRLTPAYRWQWLLTLDGEPVVQGIGDHDRRVRCEDACQKFVNLAPAADVDGTVATFRRTGVPTTSSRRART